MIMVNTCVIWNTFVEKREHTGYPIVIYICNIGKCVQILVEAETDENEDLIPETGIKYQHIQLSKMNTLID